MVPNIFFRYALSLGYRKFLHLIRIEKRKKKKVFVSPNYIYNSYIKLSKLSLFILLNAINIILQILLFGSFLELCQ